MFGFHWCAVVFCVLLPGTSFSGVACPCGTNVRQESARPMLHSVASEAGGHSDTDERLEYIILGVRALKICMWHSVILGVRALKICMWHSGKGVGGELKEEEEES